MMAGQTAAPVASEQIWGRLRNAATEKSNSACVEESSQDGSELRAQERCANSAIKPQSSTSRSETAQPMSNETVIRPKLGGFVALCMVSGILFGAASVWMAWYSAVELLQSIAVYFALLNAVLLAAAVVFCLTCTETYDMD